MPITDGLGQAVRNSALNLLRADTGPPALVVFDSKVPANTSVNAGYVLVYFYLDRPYDDPGNAQDGRSRVWVGHWICHSVSGGEDGIAAAAVNERVRTALLDARPVIAGFTAAGTGQFRLDSSLPPQRDESTGVLVMDVVSTYRLRLES
jgi:hypothetical protein